MTYLRFKEWCKKSGCERWSRIRTSNDNCSRGTVIRAHPHAAVLNVGPDNQVLGRLRGDYGTKIQQAVDKLGNPVSLHLSPCQEADIRHAETLLGNLKLEAVQKQQIDGPFAITDVDQKIDGNIRNNSMSNTV